MTSSGTSDWFLDNAGIVTEAFARCGIHPTALVREHFISATRSMNLALQSWSNRGVNLFQVDLISIPLVQGVPTYNLPSNTVNILDAYLETYSLQTSVGGSPNFSTVSTSQSVTVNIVNHGLVANNWINVVMPTVVGGVVLLGLYQVVTVLNANQFTITAAAAATGTVNFDVITQSVLYYTASATGNWTLNIRGNSSTTLNTYMATGRTVTVVFMVTQGATAYYNSAFTIDGTSVTPKWQGGTAPSAGDASSIDVYTYSITKTASATYTVLASQTQFK